MDRVADFESVGWGFESLVPRQSENLSAGGDFLFTKNVKYDIIIQQRAGRQRFTSGKELHMSDYEVITIILMVLGLVLIKDPKRK